MVLVHHEKYTYEGVCRRESVDISLVTESQWLFLLCDEMRGFRAVGTEMHCSLQNSWTGFELR